MEHTTSSCLIQEMPELAPNPQYAQLLMEAYAGVQSELTAITQYEYQHLVLFPKYPSFTRQIQRIAREEMQHLHILGSLIEALGGDAQYRARTNPTMGHYWSAQNVKYLRSMPQMLLMDIQQEKAAIETYRALQRAIHEPVIQQALHCIMLEEEQHIQILSQAIAQWQKGQLN